jgi:hypothetical protein
MPEARAGGVVVRVADAHLLGVRWRDSSRPLASRRATGGGIELLCLHRILRPISVVMDVAASSLPPGRPLYLRWPRFGCAMDVRTSRSSLSNSTRRRRILQAPFSLGDAAAVRPPPSARICRWRVRVEELRGGGHGREVGRPGRQARAGRGAARRRPWMKRPGFPRTEPRILAPRW